MSGHPRRRRSALLLAFVAMALLPPPAMAQAPELTAADLGADVTVGFGRGLSPQNWNLIEVTVTPRLAVRGAFEVQTEGPFGSTANRTGLEVAAGATKVVHLLVPPADSLHMAFRTEAGHRVFVGAQSGSTSDVLVGGLHAAPALPDPLTSVATDRAIRGVPVEGGVLHLGPRALEALDAIVITASQLADLPGEHRDHLAVAVAQGLDLVVATSVGAPSVDFPWTPTATGSVFEAVADAWVVRASDLGGDAGEPTSRDTVLAAAVPAGRGRVVAITSAPGHAGADPTLWPMLFQPREDPGLALPTMMDDSLTRVLFDNTLALPGMAGTIVLVVAFLLAVGPANMLVLRRLGRRELGWITVPIIAAVFTVGVVGTSAVRTPLTTPVARASWWLDGVGQDIDLIGLQAATRETVRAELPGRRDATILPPWAGHSVSTGHGVDRTEFGVALEALQTTTVVSWGQHQGAQPLGIAAVFEGDTLTIDVTNLTAGLLTDLQVGVATLWRNIPDLEPGATHTVVLDDLNDLPRSRAAQQWMGFRPEPMNGRNQKPKDVLIALRGGVLDERPGTVWVVGVQQPGDTAPGVRGGVDWRGHVVAVGTAPTHIGDQVLPHQVGRGFLRRHDSPWGRPGPTMIEGGEQVDLRFRLPSRRTLGPLVSTLEKGGPVRDGGMDPWMAGGCFEVTITSPDGDVEVEEHCGVGEEIACPPMATECMGEHGPRGARWLARLGDGTEWATVQVGDMDPDVGQGNLAGAEVWHVLDQRWVPASDVFVDGTADPADVVTPFGEVFLRIRNVGFLDISQRGLGVRGGTA